MIERPTFTKTRIRAGYGRAQVDLAVEQIMGTSAGPQPGLRAADVAEMAFPAAMYRPGYDMGEVDTWLDEVQVALGGQPTPAPELAPVTVTEPAPSDGSQTRSDVARALVIIAIVLFVTVKIYASRF